MNLHLHLQPHLKKFLLGILGAYLNSLTSFSSTNQHTRPPWSVDTLINTINWLKENNPYLYAYSRMLPSNLNTTNSFPIAIHLSDKEDAPPF
ncbi:413_t:CDS:2 [Gigaspora rosea]|nr:413_t:CDS:2 [Gigaspora rosea]